MSTGYLEDQLYNWGVMIDGVALDSQAAGESRLIGSNSPSCHGSSSSSSPEEEQLINIDRVNLLAKRNRFDVDDSNTKTKLKGFYAISALLLTYCTAYFTYLIASK